MDRHPHAVFPFRGPASRRGRMARRASAIALLLTPLALAAQASPRSLAAELTVFLGDDAGTLVEHPTLSYFEAGSAASSPFAIPSGVFETTRTDPIGTNVGGPAPLPPMNMFFVHQHEITQSNAAGSFGVGQGPAGGFGGTLDLGMNARILIGISPLPNIFGSINLPVLAGTTATTLQLSRYLDASASGVGWTTGTIHFGPGSPTSGTARGSRQVSTALGPHPTSTAGASVSVRHSAIRLVTPIMFVQRDGTRLASHRAGYARLSLTVRQVVPEPATASLFVASGLALFVLRGRRAPRRPRTPTR